MDKWKRERQFNNKFDVLGRPIKVGDTVLVQGYYNMNMNTIAKVIRINKNSISVDLPVSRWGRLSEGGWGREPEHIERFYRHGSQVMVLNNDLINSAKQEKEKYMYEHPEEFL